MTFANLSLGESVFLDANTLVYHFQPHPIFGPACQQLMTRIEHQELLGFTCTHILAELAHRLMMVEASALPGLGPKKTKQRIQKQPGLLKNLTAFATAIDAVLQSRIQILIVAPALILAATAISQSAGLLINDALIVAVMQNHRLTKIASNDGDFDRVPGLTRYSPA
jgi:predicted nucleic acid-binding protein